MNTQALNPHADVLIVTRFLDRMIADYGAELYVGFFYLSIIAIAWIIARAINRRQRERRIEHRLAEIRVKKLLAEEILADQIIAMHRSRQRLAVYPAPTCLSSTIIPPPLPDSQAQDGRTGSDSDESPPNSFAM